eukprot:1948956-Rhodomonas_salina.10
MRTYLRLDEYILAFPMLRPRMENVVSPTPPGTEVPNCPSAPGYHGANASTESCVHKHTSTENDVH